MVDRSARAADPGAADGTGETWPGGAIILAGAGKMGAAMLEGWLAAGVPPSHITVIEPQPGDHVQNLARQHGFAVLAAANDTVPAPDVLIMAVKPQVMDAVFQSLAKMADRNTVVLSIAAGRTIDSFARHLAHPAVVRAMPNTPAAIRRGITGAVASAAVTDAQKALCERLLRSVGDVVWVEREDLIDAVTAVSGSGPAYVFHLVEAMTAAGVAAGLDAATAGKLARATVTGAGALLDAAADQSAETLRRNVTSPGGTTAAALDVLMRADGGLTGLMTEAIQAAKKKGRELGT